MLKDKLIKQINKKGNGQCLPHCIPPTYWIRIDEAWEKLLLLFQPPPKKKNLLSPVCTYGGEGRGLVVSYICLISSSIFNTVLTSSVPASWDSSLHIPYHLCHGNEYVMNQQAWLHKVHSILPTLLQHADFGLGPIIFDMIPELDTKLAS